MRRTMTSIGIGIAMCLTIVLALTATAALQTSPTAQLTESKVQLASAGPMTFGPAGILFVGDSLGASVAAIDTGDTKAPASAVKINVDGIDTKIAALVGIAPDQIIINDVTVNPVSKNVYVSASRGRSADAAPLIVKVDGTGALTLLPLDKIRNASVSLVDAPAANPSAQRNPRTQTITGMAYVNGNVMVAGLSNEEWKSALRSIPYPFKTASQGATIQIWHSSHGQYETESPVRTFVPYTIAGQQYILAAYTCTPLVKIPVSQLTPGAKIKGQEIADLGAGNQPLDMVPYSKDGHNYILISNTAFGVLKLKADNLETYPAIVEPTRTDVAGVPFDKIAALTNVKHMAAVDGANVLLVTAKPGAAAVGSVSLSTVALP
ncbi:MAG TPA: hypothetical protein VK210_16190 [Terriglobia bacterium]|nr:hypothetical protein [Terriglobia bacterium]